jgi:ribosomal protein S18 acetylase RimI-like enzyme
MDETISYRMASVDDVPTICELGQLLNSIHHAARPDIYTSATSDVDRDRPHWMNFFEHPGHVVFMAHAGQQAVGFIMASVSSASSPLLQPLKVARVGSVCVDEDLWGRGIGRGLVQQVRAWAMQQDAQDIRLTVWAFNTRAARLYEELGFETRAYEMGMQL